MSLLTYEPLAAEDEPVVAALRAATLPRKGAILGPEARPFFDAMRAATPLPPGVRLESDTVGGVPGLWCRPADAQAGRALLFLHGGGYMMGSAEAMTGYAGQLATRAGADAFVPDYRLAPEHPFPAAVDDAFAAYRALASETDSELALAGESAGGGLTVALLTLIRAEPALRSPAGAAVMSPWVDLTLSGSSYANRAEADPIFTQEALRALAAKYLQGHAPEDPRASPLRADLSGLPPLRIDVGDDEVLLDDALRLAERAGSAGVLVTGAVWAGMPHVFQAQVGRLSAARRALDAAGEFLRARWRAR